MLRYSRGPLCQLSDGEAGLLVLHTAPFHRYSHLYDISTPNLSLPSYHFAFVENPFPPITPFSFPLLLALSFFF